MPNKRILIVDDEKPIREVLRDFFKMEGFEVCEAADGMEASRQIQKTFFDVVLTDLRLPGRDGLQVLEETRHTSPETAVLILTGHPSTDSTLRALELDCDGYLEKPIDLSRLKYMTLRGLIFRKWERSTYGYETQKPGVMKPNKSYGRAM